MKKVLILLPVLVLILTGSVSAQRITAEKTFGLNYPVSTMGYPTGIVANKDDRFSVIEYWNNDLERKFANYYVQTYSDKFEEVWFKPVTKDGDPRLTAVTDLIRLDGAVGCR